MLMNRILFNGINKISLAKCVSILDNYADSNSLSKSNYYTFRNFLNTTEEKNLEIEVLLELRDFIKDRLSKTKGNSLKYEYGHRIELIDACIMEIYFSVNMVNEGIKYINGVSTEKKSDIYNLILSALKEKELYDDYFNQLNVEECIKIISKWKDASDNANLDCCFTNLEDIYKFKCYLHSLERSELTYILDYIDVLKKDHFGKMLVYYENVVVDKINDLSDDFR